MGSAAAEVAGAAAGGGVGWGIAGLLASVLEAVQSTAAKPATNGNWCVAWRACMHESHPIHGWDGIASPHSSTHPTHGWDGIASHPLHPSG